LKTIIDAKLDLIIALIIASNVYSLKGSILSYNVPLNKTGY